nr:C13 family peptidase [Bacteroides zhangwenhongii]
MSGAFPQSLSGKFFIAENGKDVRKGVKVDYKFSLIAPANLEAMLSGQDDERLPEVIRAGKQDNIFILWNGYDIPDVLC